MLLNKNAFLRASVSELIAMQGLQERVEKFKKFNEEYLAQMEGQRRKEEQEQEEHMRNVHPQDQNYYEPQQQFSRVGAAAAA